MNGLSHWKTSKSRRLCGVGWRREKLLLVDMTRERGALDGAAKKRHTEGKWKEKISFFRPLLRACSWQFFASNHQSTRKKRKKNAHSVAVMLVPFWVCCMFELFNFYGDIHNVKRFYWVVAVRGAAAAAAIDFIMAVFAGCRCLFFAFCSLPGCCCWFTV